MRLGPLIIGHRGASAVAPENTIAAFTRAIQAGADGIEFDVRLSRDHVPVVIHDRTLKRTAFKDALVSELTAKELSRRDVGSWFSRHPDESFTGEMLPRLSQVFDLFLRMDGLLYLELKSDGDEARSSLLAAEVVRMIREYELVGRVIVECFELTAIAEIKRIDDEVRTAALFEPRLSRPISTIRRLKMIDLALEHHANEIAFHHTLASRTVVAEARRSGLDVVVWTVDDEQWIERAQLMDVKALITNDPARMAMHRSQVQTHSSRTSTFPLSVDSE